MAIAQGSVVIAAFAGLALGLAAPASAVDDMNGHYTMTETYPDGHSVNSDWYFTYCENGPGNGCSQAASQPGGQPFGRALFQDGKWRMLGSGGGDCPDRGDDPNPIDHVYTWDPNTFAGTVLFTNTAQACGHPPGYQETHNIQLTQAP